MSIESQLQAYVDSNNAEGVYSLREKLIEYDIPLKKALNKAIKNNYSEIAAFLLGLCNERSISIAFKSVYTAFENGNFPLVRVLLTGDVSLDTEDTQFIEFLDTAQKDLIEELLTTALRLVDIDVVDIILSNYLDLPKKELTSILGQLVNKIEAGLADPEVSMNLIHLLINKGANPNSIPQLKASKNYEKTLLNFKLNKDVKKQTPRAMMSNEEVIIEEYTKPNAIRGVKHKITTKYLTKYELAKVLGTRATMISEGHPILIDPQGETDPLKIALMEIKQKKIPLVVRRPLPNGQYENHRVSDLIYDG